MNWLQKTRRAQNADGGFGFLFVLFVFFAAIL